MREFIVNIPKAEVHIHLEGALDPELLFLIAQRNNVTLPYSSVAELKKAYVFKNLQDFLELCFQGMRALRTEQDFYDLMMGYLKKARSQGVVYAEISFEAQTYAQRGIAFETIITGINRACGDGLAKFGISAKLILCFLRDREEREALEVLEQILPYKDSIIAVGLASAERGNPPSKFQRVFAKAREYGFFVTVHAGEEGPAEYIWQALTLLHADRIDHGINALQDEKLVEELVRRQIPLTLCPLSNLKLRLVKDLREYPIKNMIAAGLLASINSDDPAYFGGYVADNYQAVVDALNLSQQEIIQLAKNSFQSSFLSEDEKQKMCEKVDQYVTTQTSA